MTRLILIAPFVLSGCLLDRSALGCDPSDLAPACHPDAFVDGDAHVTPGDSGPDAFVDGDAGPMPDAFIADGGLDSGSDAGFDAGTDVGVDAFVSPDAYVVPDAGMRRCESTTSGVCIRFHNLSGDMPIMGWNAQFIWTRVGGSLLTMPSDGSYPASCASFRTIDADTTECEITVPDPGTPVLSGYQIFAFPVYAASVPACSNTSSPACPNFYMGYSMWHDGVSFSTNPVDGSVSIASRPYATGSLRMIEITLF